MTRYPVQPRDQTFVEDYEIYLLLKICAKILVKIQVKTLVANTVNKFLIMIKDLQQMHLKLLLKDQFKKYQKEL